MKGFDKMKIVKLSNVENNELSKYIFTLLKRYENYKEVEAVFLNCYQLDGKNYIDINFIKRNYLNIDSMEINLPNVNNVIVNVVSIPSLDINYSLLSEKEIFVADKIKNGYILKDTNDNYYTNFKDRISSLSIDNKNDGKNNVLFEPPLTLKRVNK